MLKLAAALVLSVVIFLTAPSTQAQFNNSGTKAAVSKSAGQVHQQVTAPEAPLKPAETPAPQPPVSQIVAQGCDAYKQILAKYNWNVDVMTAVMRAESGCNPNAINTANYDGVADYGLMQLHGQEIYDPATNISHAYHLWTVQGYKAWSVFNNGKYLSYL